MLAAVVLSTSLLLGHTRPSYAGTNLLVTPTRVVFDGRKRSAQVTLMNQGDEAANFRISFIRQNMTENGKFVPVKKGVPGKYSDEMIRYSPRQVTLKPGQPQIIRLLLRKPRNLEDGEYRSHMLFQALPNPKKSNVQQLTKKRNKGISVELIPIVGVSIPVIVKQGKVSGAVSLSDAKIVETKGQKARKSVSVLMSRSGNGSVYGDFKVVFTPTGGEPVVIGQAIGVAVYTPNPHRRFDIPLQIPPKFKLANGELHVTFTESGKTPETGLLAEIRSRL
jgi:hypothetical protein